MRRGISGEGLFWAFVVVFAILALAAASVGFVMGAGDHALAYATIAIVAGVALISAEAHRRRTAAPTPAPSTSEQPRYVVLEITWAVLLVGAIIACVVIDGPQRVPWILVAGVAIWQLATWERRRRRRDDADA